MSHLVTVKHTSVSSSAQCGPAPSPAHSRVVRHNSSVVLHRCKHGYDHQGGTNVSVCQDSGRWQAATLTCAGERQVPLSSNRPVGLMVSLSQRRRPLSASWRWSTAGVSSGDQTGSGRSLDSTRFLSHSCPVPPGPILSPALTAVDLQVAYSGRRDFQASFHHRGRQVVSSEDQQVALCLDLLPLTNYSVTVSELSSNFTVSVRTCTPLTGGHAHSHGHTHLLLTAHTHILCSAAHS